MSLNPGRNYHGAEEADSAFAARIDKYLDSSRHLRAVVLEAERRFEANHRLDLAVRLTTPPGNLHQ